MPYGKTISFGAGNGDLEAQQAELQRRQMMIDALRKQASTPQETQVVSGRAIQKSPWEVAAQLAQIGASAYAQKNVDTKQAELTTEKSKRQSEALKSLAPAGMFDDQPPATESGPDDPQKPSIDPQLREAWTRALRTYQNDPKLGADMIKNLTDLTSEQKDLQSQGIDPKLFGAARLAKLKKEGLLEVTPGGTVYDPNANKPVFAGPDFKGGMNNQIGPNGQPMISPMQGAENIPRMAGEIKSAEAAAQAGQDMVTVNTPEGPRMMTRAQAVQMSGAPAAPAPQQPNTFTASNGVVVNLGNTSPQQLMQSAQQSGDPGLIQAAQEYAQKQTQQPQQAPQGPAQPQAPGIQLQTPAQAEQQIGTVRNALDVDKARLLAAQSPEAQQKLTDAGSVIDLTKSARSILESGAPTGSFAGSLRDKVTGAMGMSTDASKASAQLAALGGALVAKQPKMSGPQSDKDVMLYKEMAGRIGDSNVPIGDRLAALEIIESINKKYVSQNEGSIAGQALKANMGAQPAAAPSTAGFKVIR